MSRVILSVSTGLILSAIMLDIERITIILQTWRAVPFILSLVFYIIGLTCLWRNNNE